MNTIPISDLRDKYNEIERKNNYPPKKFPLFLNFLYLSIHNIRDEDEFNQNNYQLLKTYLKKKNIYKLEDKYLKRNGDYFTKYITNFKEYKYLLSKKLIIQFLNDLFKLTKNFIDMILIIIIFSLFTLKNSIKKFFISSTKYKDIKFYSIYYCKKKGLNSARYLYPGIKNNDESIAFITSFHQKKFFFPLTILFSLRNNFSSPLKVLEIKDLFVSVIQLITLFIFDLFLTFKKEYSFLKFWFTWTSISKVFYSILVYNSIIRLVKNSENCEFISWYENQMEIRSFSLGFSYAKKRFNSSSTLSTFYGSPLVLNSKRQYFPLIDEIKNGFWGEKFYLQDEDSCDEMNSYINKKNLSISTEIVENSMRRVMKNSRKKANLKNRNITIFTHDTNWDLIACLIAINNKNNFTSKVPTNLLSENNLVYIRLHPDLNKSEILKEIMSFGDISKYLKLRFIDNKKESISDSINLSRYCFFGLSNYINLAIKLNANVVAVETTHLNHIPFKSDYLNSESLNIFNPW